MDKRTITYFYELDKEKGQKMILALQVEGGVSYAAAYKWMKGIRKPLPLYQNLIRKLVKQHYGVNVPRKELFG